MVNLKIKLPQDFFEEKTEYGFTVDVERKKIWAVELDLLNEFDRVCKNHNLTYMLSFGSLLGAIRHKGFIPWDDDVDVIMKREDYDTLLKIGPSEFQHPYFFQNPITEKSRYFRPHCQLRNSLTTGLIKGDEEREINRGIFLDIFVLDKMPSKKVSKHYQRAFSLCVLAEYLMRCRNYSRTTSLSFGMPMKSIVQWLIGHIIPMDNSKYFQIWNWHESRYKNRQCDALVQSLRHDRYRVYSDPSIWDKVVETDFETLRVTIPARYSDLLRLWYKDWETPRNIPCVHNGMTASADISYIDYLKQSTNEESTDNRSI